ncbi:putative glutamate-1-semialdehyde 2,1-aminomutase [Polychaeton citri CBS 116435]|uniref:Glutamate-1-semialdehyde 2,1-aminomutase n=1 Tax=Polychaeton citri CBS 116435 TaxID=1314669 RepID=A0A9P4Q9K5_9PEZI|nr:putative glutamate-1-semialdehyde 2,1-aminomutase [Polychaeton citri CBS 116435]
MTIYSDFVQDCVKASRPDTTYETVEDALQAAHSRYRERNPTSLELYDEATESLPGGNTRSLLHHTPFPVYMKHGTGHQVFSEDGHAYTDFVGELTAALYGHSHPLILDTLHKTLDTMGLNLGATTRLETEHAKLMCQRFNIGKVRFTNSGTESNLHAIQAARYFTGKRKIVVFTGGYHGGVFDFTAPDGLAAKNVVDRGEFLILPYNDVTAIKQIEMMPDVAAVLVEGMQGAGPCICGTDEFLLQIQHSTRESGAVFILDEVMTSRLAPGGLRSLVTGLKPDMMTFGKYLGGGITFGAFGGSENIMAVYDPRMKGALAHSGTFNNNTLSLAAGAVGLSQIFTSEVCIQFNQDALNLISQLQEISKGTKLTVLGRGSVFGVHFLRDGAKDLVNVSHRHDDFELKELFWLEMMEDGFWITKRGSVALILGTPASELQRFVDAVKGFLERHEKFVKLGKLAP